jgi:type VI secretion system secreted protein Hcp
MSDVIVTSVTQGDADKGAHSENVSLVFAKVDLEYVPQRPDGSADAAIHFKYDILANKGA